MSAGSIIISIVYLILDIFLSLFAMLTLYDKKFSIKCFLAYSSNRALYYFMNTLPEHGTLTPFLAFLGTIITLLTIYFFFDNNIGRGIIKMFTIEVCFTISCRIIQFLLKDIMEYKLCAVLFSQDENYFIGIVSLFITYITTTLEAYGIRKLFKKDFPPIVYNMSSLALIGVTLFIFVSSTIMGNNVFSTEYFSALVLMLSSLVLAGLIIIGNLKTEKHLRQENEYLTRLNELQYEHYTALNDYQQQLRVMRHDIVNHLHTIQIMTDNGDTAECRDYADELIGQYKSIYTALCENKPVDALLHSKMSEAQSKNITLTANVSISEDTRIKPVDLVCIFSNLLDNAITAAESSEKKTVAISAAEKNDMLTIKCENSFSGIIKIRKDFTVKTTKNDSFNHGLGTGIIKSTAEKYGGNVFCETAGDTFTYIVSIPNNINELKGENHA